MADRGSNTTSSASGPEPILDPVSPTQGGGPVRVGTPQGKDDMKQHQHLAQGRVTGVLPFPETNPARR
jgi:hypothetical protein